ncbi:LOW QUALITY PROTEIN: hypothetical protein HID58_050887 [Brassica napus]|uniref:Uncharacterized protein n=1 Tax=Brassica napus TaxID=3708 RepID=A0ABQ8A891_BRANA|nr:LOW QUALITY PROTEIN: hypothetical protein HID58_050887 [Brassica napus]
MLATLSHTEQFKLQAVRLSCLDRFNSGVSVTMSVSTLTLYRFTNNLKATRLTHVICSSMPPGTHFYFDKESESGGSFSLLFSNSCT